MWFFDLLWSRVTATAATAIMALVGLANSVLEEGPLRNWIEEYRLPLLIGLVAFLVAHAFRNWKKERAQLRGVLGNFERINNNVLHLISDLAELSSRHYHHWFVDLYVERKVISLSPEWPFMSRNVLEKRLSVALSGVSEMPLKIHREHEVFGVLAARDVPLMWWDQQFTQTQLDIPNAQAEFTERANESLMRSYGVVKVWPVTDDLRRNRKGILVVHTRRDAVAATAALGVLAGEQGDRLCARAAQNIHGELRS